MTSPAPNYYPEESFLKGFIKSKSLSENKCVPTFLSALDKVIGGFHNSNLTIIGGRPAMGCRQLVLTMACKQAWKNRKVACFFMTLTESDIVSRLQRIYMSNNEPEVSLPPLLYIDYKLNIDELHNEIERLKKEENIEVVYVESVQMIDINEPNETPNKEEYVVKALWKMSREFDIPIIALSSLSRRVEYRWGDRYPILGDLRGSATIELYADMVLLLHRMFYYGFKVDEFGNSIENAAQIIVAKNVNGQLADVKLSFDHSTSVFVDEILPLPIPSKINKSESPI